MHHRSRARIGLTFVFAFALGGASAPARAQDADFQAFFFSACSTSAGALNTRCSETPGGGNLSGDSERSLNPNQVLSNHDPAINRAQERSKSINNLLDARRGDDPAQAQHDREVAQITDRLGFILTGRGTWYERDPSPIPAGAPTISERGFDGTIWGLGAGFDYRVTDRLLLGLLFNFDRTDGSFDPQVPAGAPFTAQSNEGTRQSNAYIISLIGSYAWANGLYLDGHLGGGGLDFDLRRNVIFQESGRSSQMNVNTVADVGGAELSASGGIGWDKGWRALSGGAYFRTRYIIDWIDDYREQGGSGLAMAYPERSQESLTTIVGLRSSYALSTGIGVIVPQVRVEWEHEFLRDGLVTAATYLDDTGGNAFAMAGDAPDRDYINLGVGVAMVMKGGLMPFVDYQGLFAYKEWSRQRFTAGFRKEF